MEEVSFKIEMSEEAKAAREALLSKLRRDESFIDADSGLLQQSLATKTYCERCQGLSFCVHEPQGHYLDLTYDGVLTYGLRACAHYNDEQARLHHQRRYTVMDFGRDDLQIDLTTLDVSKESADYK